jgi:hypothetical protein
MHLIRASALDRFADDQRLGAGLDLSGRTASARSGGAGSFGPDGAGARLRTALARAATVASLAAIAVGLVGLGGWILDLPVLRSFIPGEVPIALGTSVCFVVVGCSSLLLGTA